MKLTQKSGTKITMTAAALIMTGAFATVAMSTELNGRCFGVGGCAGKGACKTTKNDCKGHNKCKGQGWVEMLREECANQNGQYQKS